MARYRDLVVNLPGTDPPPGEVVTSQLAYEHAMLALMMDVRERLDRLIRVTEEHGNLARMQVPSTQPKRPWWSAF